MCLTVSFVIAVLVIAFSLRLRPARAQEQSAPPAADSAVWQIRMSRSAISSATPEDGIAGAQAICDYFVEEYDSAAGTRSRAQVQIAPSIESVEHGLTDGSVHYAFVTPMEWLRLQEKADAELIAITTPEGAERLTRAVFLVRAGDPAKSISDLKGRAFARSGATSTVGYLFPQSLLLSNGLPKMDLFFSRVLDVHGDKSAFYAVALGDADCAAVDETLLRTLRELSPGVAKKCRVLISSEPMPSGVVVASRKNNREGMKVVVQTLARGSGAGQVRVREAMRLVRIGGLSMARPEDFDHVRKLWTAVNDADWHSVDPVCGRECLPADAETAGTDGLSAIAGTVTMRFCSIACRDTYLRRAQASRAAGTDRIFVLGVSRPLWAERKWADVVSGSAALLDEVARKSGLRFVIEVYPHLDALEARAREGTMALVNVPATDYLRLHRDVGAEALVRPVTTGDTDRVVLVAKSPNHKNGVAGLRGKRIAYSRASDLPTYSYLRHLTHGLGRMEPEDVFSQLVQCPSDLSCARAVAMDQADAALVSDAALHLMIEMTPGAVRGLERVIASPDLTSGPICVMPNVTAADAARIQSAILALGGYPEGRQLLALYGCERIVAAADGDYASVRALVGEDERP